MDAGLPGRKKVVASEEHIVKPLSPPVSDKSDKPTHASRRYLYAPVAKMYPGSQGWRCMCADVKPYRRHREPWECRKEFTTTQRVLAWLKEEFGR